MLFNIPLRVTAGLLQQQELTFSIMFQIKKRVAGDVTSLRSWLAPSCGRYETIYTATRASF